MWGATWCGIGTTSCSARRRQAVRASTQNTPTMARSSFSSAAKATAFRRPVYQPRRRIFCDVLSAPALIAPAINAISIAHISYGVIREWRRFNARSTRSGIGWSTTRLSVAGLRTRPVTGRAPAARSRVGARARLRAAATGLGAGAPVGPAAVDGLNASLGTIGLALLPRGADVARAQNGVAHVFVWARGYRIPA